MDIYCPKCAEPWELDTLHEEVKERYPDIVFPGTLQGEVYARYRKAYDKAFNSVRKEFASKGCATFSFAGPCEANAIPWKGELIAEIYDLLGDDIDGAACLLEDAALDGLI